MAADKQQRILGRHKLAGERCHVSGLEKTETNKSKSTKHQKRNFHNRGNLDRVHSYRLRPVGLHGPYNLPRRRWNQRLPVFPRYCILKQESRCLLLLEFAFSLQRQVL